MDGSIRHFVWHTFDVRPDLPDGWQADLLAISESAVSRALTPTSVTSREDSSVRQVPVSTVGGLTLDEKAPWLLELYRTLFRDLGQSIVNEKLSTARDPRISINLNVQRGSAMRYEAHVDSNPLEGLLYVTDHPAGSGGELVVSQVMGARGIREIEENAAIIYPKAGHLVFFDAREHAHYVRPLRSADGVRVVAAMNFYTPSCSEDDRPADLNRHLFGTD